MFVCDEYEGKHHKGVNTRDKLGGPLPTYPEPRAEHHDTHQRYTYRHDQFSERQQKTVLSGYE
jgi:hypothetical protein